MMQTAWMSPYHHNATLVPSTTVAVRHRRCTKTKIVLSVLNAAVSIWRARRFWNPARNGVVDAVNGENFAIFIGFNGSKDCNINIW